MFQFTPYNTYYAGYTAQSDPYAFTQTLDANIQPYLFYYSGPAENYQNWFLQNAQNSFAIPHRSSITEKEELNHCSNHTSVQEKRRNQEKIQSSKDHGEIKQQANKQKFGRNILSNIFHLMLKFIKRQKKFKKLIEKLIQTNGMTIKTNEFYQILKRKSSKMKAYASLQQIKDFWTGNSHGQTQKNFIKQQECSKLLRILGKLYLEKYHIPYVFNSNKIKKQSKALHNSAIRKIKALC